MSKKYNITPSKKQIDKMKLFWAMLKQEENDFYSRVYTLERNMSEEVGIDSLEFFTSDDGFCGVGNLYRTMRLIPDTELEKN